MDFSGFGQCPTCSFCGDSHMSAYCHVSSSFSPFPQNSYLTGSDHRNYPEASSDHLSSDCYVNFSSGPSFEPTYYANENFCRNDRYPSYPQPAITYSANNHEEWPTEWEYRGDSQWAEDHHDTYQGGHNSSFSWEESKTEMSTSFSLQPQEKASTTEDSLIVVIQRMTAEKQRQLNDYLERDKEKALEYERELRKSVQRITDQLQQIQDALGLNDEIRTEKELHTLENGHIVDDGWSNEEKQLEENLDEPKQVSEEWLYDWYLRNVYVTPPEVGNDEDEKERDPSEEPRELRDSSEEFKEIPKEDTSVLTFQDSLVENFMETREMDVQMETQVQSSTLELQELKGSFSCPLLTFTPLFPCMMSPDFDLPYILPVIVDCISMYYWEMVVYGLLKICSIFRAPIFRACKDDVRNNWRDITFPFDRG